MSDDNIVSLADARLAPLECSPETIAALESALAEAKAGNILAVGLCFARRAPGGTLRTQCFEASAHGDAGQRVYLLGLCQRLAHSVAASVYQS